MAHEFIDRLPKGYETQLGRWFDDGHELSLGQWQKVALSRAFMRDEADILVLDEPTASMDAEAEATVFERFGRLAEDKGCSPPRNRPGRPAATGFDGHLDLVPGEALDRPRDGKAEGRRRR